MVKRKRGRGKQKAPNAVGLSKKQMKKEQRQRGSKAAKTAGAQPASMGGQRRHTDSDTWRGHWCKQRGSRSNADGFGADDVV